MVSIREPNVTPDMDYSEVQKKVRQAIEDYFKLELGRPEILNRIGENIVVFDFIRPDVAKLILDAQVNKIIKNLATEIQPDNSYMMSGNRISVKTLDLNCSFSLIAAQLNAIADNLISWFSEMDSWGKTFIPQACEILKIKYWYAINKEKGSEEVILTALLKQDA